MIQRRKPPESFGSIATNSIEDGKYLNTNTGLYETRTDLWCYLCSHEIGHIQGGMTLRCSHYTNNSRTSIYTAWHCDSSDYKQSRQDLRIQIPGGICLGYMQICYFKERTWAFTDLSTGKGDACGQCSRPNPSREMTVYIKSVFYDCRTSLLHRLRIPCSSVWVILDPCIFSSDASQCLRYLQLRDRLNIH